MPRQIKAGRQALPCLGGRKYFSKAVVIDRNQTYRSDVSSLVLPSEPIQKNIAEEHLRQKQLTKERNLQEKRRRKSRGTYDRSSESELFLPAKRKSAGTKLNQVEKNITRSIVAEKSAIQHDSNLGQEGADKETSPVILPSLERNSPKTRIKGNNNRKVNSSTKILEDDRPSSNVNCGEQGDKENSLAIKVPDATVTANRILLKRNKSNVQKSSADFPAGSTIDYSKILLENKLSTRASSCLVEDEEEDEGSETTNTEFVYPSQALSSGTASAVSLPFVSQAKTIADNIRFERSPFISEGPSKGRAKRLITYDSETSLTFTNLVHSTPAACSKRKSRRLKSFAKENPISEQSLTKANTDSHVEPRISSIKESSVARRSRDRTRMCSPSNNQPPVATVATVEQRKSQSSADLHVETTADLVHVHPNDPFVVPTLARSKQSNLGTSDRSESRRADPSSANRNSRSNLRPTSSISFASFDEPAVCPPNHASENCSKSRRAQSVRQSDSPQIQAVPNDDQPEVMPSDESVENAVRVSVATPVSRSSRRSSRPSTVRGQDYVAYSTPRDLPQTTDRRTRSKDVSDAAAAAETPSTSSIKHFYKMVNNGEETVTDSTLNTFFEKRPKRKSEPLFFPTPTIAVPNSADFTPGCRRSRRTKVEGRGRLVYKTLQNGTLELVTAEKVTVKDYELLKYQQTRSVKPPDQPSSEYERALKRSKIRAKKVTGLENIETAKRKWVDDADQPCRPAHNWAISYDPYNDRKSGYVKIRPRSCISRFADVSLNFVVAFGELAVNYENCARIKAASDNFVVRQGTEYTVTNMGNKNAYLYFCVV